eukprot:Opistho-1_new@5073
MIIFTVPGFSMIEHRITDYLQYLRFEKRYAQHTLGAYERDLSQFNAYVSSQFGLDDERVITHFHIRSWLATFKEQDLQATSINRKLSAVNSFYKYMLKMQAVKKNPVRQLHAMRRAERLPVYLKEQETEHLLEEVQFEEGFKGFTDRMICELLYQTGMRRSEIVNLKEKDIETSLKQIRILGKGNKERLVPVSPALLSDIDDYINEKRKLENHDTTHLLVLESGLPLYAGYVYRVVKTYLSSTTTLHKKSPHVLCVDT